MLDNANGRIEFTPSFSIVILSYNYANYLAQAIESALGQTYRHREVIVVDDGSTDNSVEIIRSFGSAVRMIAKPNGGQASAMNVGFAECRGDYVLFLDSDDLLRPDALARHADALKSGAVRSQAYLDCVDAAGLSTGDRLPGKPAPDGDLAGLALEFGPGAVVSVPASGNAWRRSALEDVFPLPENAKAAADAFLIDVAPLLGTIKTVDEGLGAHRLHSSNASIHIGSFDLAAIRNAASHFSDRLGHMERVATAKGFSVSQIGWQNRNWRLLTLLHLLNRHGMRQEKTSWRRHLHPVVNSRSGIVKRAAITCFILAVRILPLRASVRLCARVVKLQYM